MAVSQMTALVGGDGASVVKPISYPALPWHGDFLVPGRYELDRGAVDFHFVRGVPGSLTRPTILAHYDLFCSVLLELGLMAHHMIGGSFVSKKRDPSDIDLVCTCSVDEINHLPNAAYAKLESCFCDDLSPDMDRCDMLLALFVSEDHPDYEEFSRLAENHRQFLQLSRDRMEVGVVTRVICPEPVGDVLGGADE